jgi:predicted dehydrogenase
MRIGIVGLHYGHIGGMLQSARAADDAEFVGVVEKDDLYYDRHIPDQTIPRYNNIDELIAEARPELIIEGLKHNEKTELVEKCAAADIHLLLDKPLCRTLADWTRMLKALKKSNSQLSMWFTSRAYPPFVALRQIVERGELGDIVSLVSTHPHKLQRETATPWYFDDGEYTGTFHDLACHGIDQIRLLTGAEFTGVHALGTCKRFTDEPRLTDHTQASFSLANGSTAALTADWLTPQDSPSFGDTRFIVMGTRGSAHLRAYAEDHLYVVANGKGAYEPKLPADCGRLFVQELIQPIERGESPFIGTRDVLAVSHAALMAQESIARGGEFMAIGNIDL